MKYNISGKYISLDIQFQDTTKSTLCSGIKTNCTVIVYKHFVHFVLIIYIFLCVWYSIFFIISRNV